MFSAKIRSGVNGRKPDRSQYDTTSQRVAILSNKTKKHNNASEKIDEMSGERSRPEHHVSQTCRLDHTQTSILTTASRERPAGELSIECKAQHTVATAVVLPRHLPLHGSKPASWNCSGCFHIRFHRCVRVRATQTTPTNERLIARYTAATERR